jgi:hypothetical protein
VLPRAAAGRSFPAQTLFKSPELTEKYAKNSVNPPDPSGFFTQVMALSRYDC